MLGVKPDRVPMVLQIANGGFDDAEIFFRLAAKDVLHMKKSAFTENGLDRSGAAAEGAEGGILLREQGRFMGGTEGHQGCVTQGTGTLHFLKEAEILRVGSRIPGFNPGNAKIVQGGDNLLFIFHRKCNPFRLSAVAQGGIQHLQHKNTSNPVKIRAAAPPAPEKTGSGGEPADTIIPRDEEKARKNGQILLDEWGIQR